LSDNSPDEELQERSYGEPHSKASSRQLRWVPVLDEFGQVTDWRCPKCGSLIHLASSGRAICPQCGRSALEFIPKDEPSRDPSRDRDLARFLKAAEFRGVEGLDKF